MRSVFHKIEHNIADVMPQQREMDSMSKPTIKNERRLAPKRVPTPQQRFVRRRRLAILTIIASLGIACRWHVANLEPTYPDGEGVYQESIVTEGHETKQPNAAMFYMAAADAFHVDVPEGLVNGTHGLRLEPLSVQKPVVEQAQPAFALLRQGMKYPYRADRSDNYFVHQPTVGDVLKTHNYAPVREMARMLVVESRVKAASGDTSGALQSSLDAVRLGTDYGQGDSLLEGLLGILLQMTGVFEGIRHVDGLSASESRAGAERLEQMLKQERTFAQIMTAERDTMSYDMLDEVFRTGKLQGLNSATSQMCDFQGTQWKFAFGAMVFAYTKQGLVNDFAQQHDRILRRTKMPYQLAKRLEPVQPSSNPLVRYWVDYDFKRAFRHTVRQSSYNRVLLTQLAIQAYREEHAGIPPTSLSELATGRNPYISAVPNDPYSMTGDFPLGYDPIKGKAYSVGENGIDDGNTGDDNSNLYE